MHLPALAFALLATCVCQASDIAFPSHAGVADVTQAPWHAKGNGIDDDSAALESAIHDTEGGNRILYLPAGTYLLEPRDEGAELRQAGVERGQHGGWGVEQFSPVRPGAERDEQGFDLAGDVGDGLGRTGPGEVQADGVAAFGGAEPQAVRGHGADFGDRQRPVDARADGA